jgi:hypothetical protein
MTRGLTAVPPCRICSTRRKGRLTLALCDELKNVWEDALQLILNPHIPDQEEKALSLLGRLLLRPWKYADKVGILNPTTIENLSGSETIDAVAEVSPTVAEYLLEQVEAQWEKRRVEKAGQWMAKAHNRVEYLATGTIEMREAKSKSEETIHRWHGEIRLANAGLISRMVETIYGAPKEPVTLSVVNMLPPSAELGLRHAPVNPIHWEHMLEMGMAVSGERVAWQMKQPRLGPPAPVLPAGHRDAGLQPLPECAPHRRWVHPRRGGHVLQPLLPGGGGVPSCRPAATRRCRRPRWRTWSGSCSGTSTSGSRSR